MLAFRKCIAMLLSVALAFYGAAATSPAHAHDSAGYHGVHIVMDHQHDHGHHDAPHGGPAAGDEESTSPVSDHHETGFHSHGAPQFAPAVSAGLAFVSLTIGWIDFFDPGDLVAKAPDESPFKPPRARL